MSTVLRMWCSCELARRRLLPNGTTRNKRRQTKWKTKLAILLIREKRFGCFRCFERKKNISPSVAITRPLLPPDRIIFFIWKFCNQRNRRRREPSSSSGNKWKSTYSHSIYVYASAHVMIITILRVVIHTDISSQLYSYLHLYVRVDWHRHTLPTDRPYVSAARLYIRSYRVYHQRSTHTNNKKTDIRENDAVI